MWWETIPQLQTGKLRNRRTGHPVTSINIYCHWFVTMAPIWAKLAKTCLYCSVVKWVNLKILIHCSLADDTNNKLLVHLNFQNDSQHLQPPCAAKYLVWWISEFYLTLGTLMRGRKLYRKQDILLISLLIKYMSNSAFMLKSSPLVEWNNSP